MATEAQIIEHLRKLSAYKERPECDSDGIPHYIDSGNMDDAYGIGETDGGINLAKALIDRGVHPPTVYFPIHVPEAIMIEPTETESRETLDRFCDAVIECLELAQRDPAALRRAPVTTPVGRLDEVAAARRMDLVAPE